MATSRVYCALMQLRQLLPIAASCHERLERLSLIVTLGVDQIAALDPSLTSWTSFRLQIVRAAVANPAFARAWSASKRQARAACRVYLAVQPRRATFTKRCISNFERNLR